MLIAIRSFCGVIFFLLSGFPFVLRAETQSVSIASSRNAFGEGVRTLRPNSVYIEAFGRNLGYTIGADHTWVDGHLTLGSGLGTVVRNTSGQVPMLLPYVSYYFLNQIGSPFLTFGLNLPLNPGRMRNEHVTMTNFQFNSMGFATHLGLGWEYRAERGYLFRVTSYVIGGWRILPWLGATVGYSF